MRKIIDATRTVVISDEVDRVIKETCLEIEKRYEVKFFEIGPEKDHAHFLVQSVPTYDVSKLVRMIKSITAKQVFERCPEVKKQLLGGYYTGTVSKHGNEEVISSYVKKSRPGSSRA